MKKGRTKNLTEGNIYKNYLFFAVPLILAALLSAAYNTIDGIIAGKFIGNFALGAIGATHSFDLMLDTLFLGFSIGFSIYLARLFGQGDYGRLKSDLINFLLFISCLLLVVAVLCILFANVLLDFLRIDEQIRQDALNYFVICKTGYLFILLNSIFIQLFNALGTTGFAFYMSLLSAFLNIGGNLFTVLVLKLGIVGIALSTVLSAFAVTVCYIFKLIGVFSQLPAEKRKFKFSLLCVRASLRYSLPASCQQGIMYLSGLVISPMINVLGAAATTGYEVSNRFYSICAHTYQNSAKAVSTYTAQSIGARKFDTIKKGLYVGLLQGAALTLPFVLVCFFFTHQISALFFSSDYSGEAFDIAVRFCRLYLPLIFFNLINNLAHSFFRGAGAMKYLFVSTLIGSVVRIAATVCLADRFGIDGIFLGWVISWIAEMIYCLFIYFLCFHRQNALISEVHRLNNL